MLKRSCENMQRRILVLLAGTRFVRPLLRWMKGSMPLTPPPSMTSSSSREGREQLKVQLPNATAPLGMEQTGRVLQQQLGREQLQVCIVKSGGFHSLGCSAFLGIQIVFKGWLGTAWLRARVSMQLECTCKCTWISQKIEMWWTMKDSPRSMCHTGKTAAALLRECTVNLRVLLSYRTASTCSGSWVWLLGTFFNNVIKTLWAGSSSKPLDAC